MITDVTHKQHTQHTIHIAKICTVLLVSEGLGLVSNTKPKVLVSSQSRKLMSRFRSSTFFGLGLRCIVLGLGPEIEGGRLWVSRKDPKSKAVAYGSQETFGSLGQFWYRL